MADTTTTANPDAEAGHRGGSFAAYANQANKAPADQAGYDPKDAKWATVPGVAARLNGYPRAS